jgi:hypothetical protein
VRDLRVRVKSAPGSVPQAYISQVQAVKACANAGKRLCKDDEWIAACRSVNNTRFSYGNDEKRGTCNDHRDQHPAMQYLESHDLSVFTKLEHPCIDPLAHVGDRRRKASAARSAWAPPATGGRRLPCLDSDPAGTRSLGRDLQWSPSCATLHHRKGQKSWEP